MSKRKNVIRVGDKVKIITPEVFQRVGYPLTTDMIKESHITDEQKQLMNKLMATCGYNMMLDKYTFGTTLSEYDKLEHTFATL